MLTLHPLSSASLIGLNIGGSHDTAKFSVIVFGNDASTTRWEHNEPERSDAAIELRHEGAMVQFSRLQFEDWPSSWTNDEYRT